MPTVGTRVVKRTYESNKIECRSGQSWKRAGTLYIFGHLRDVRDFSRIPRSSRLSRVGNSVEEHEHPDDKPYVPTGTRTFREGVGCVSLRTVIGQTGHKKSRGV